MSDKIEVGASSSGEDGINRLTSSIDRLEASLAKLGGNNNAMTRMAKQMEGMTKAMKNGFDQMIELQSTMEARSARMSENAAARRLAQVEEKAEREVRAAAAAAEKKLQQQVAFEQKQEASGNKFHYKQIEAADTAYAKQLGDYVKFWEKIVATQVAAEATQTAIQQRRDTEMHAASARAFVDYVSWWDKTLAADEAKQAKQLERARLQQVELAGIAASGAEKQRLLNTNFITSPLSSQIATAEKAVVYSSLGGNASERFGAAAAAADIAELRRQHALLPGAVQNSTSSISAHNAVMNEGHALARGLAGSLGGLWLTYGSLVPLAAGAALAGSMKAVISAGKDVEYQLKFVQALGGGSVGLNNLLHITDQTVVSVKEAAEGMRALAQNGLSASDSLKVLPSILNLAVIGEMSVSNAALAATGTVSAFGLQLSDLDRVSNIFAKAAATSNTSVSAMTESMKQASTVAGIYGASVEETAGALGILAKVNIIGTAAGTAYTNMLTNLYTPTEKAKKALAELKITTDDGNGGLKNSTQLLGELRVALSGFNDASQATFLGDIFTVRGQKGASTILSNWDEYIKKTNEAREVTNFMGEAVAMLEDTTTGAMKRLANNASASLDRAFSSSSPALQALVTHLAEIAGSQAVVDMLTGIADALLRVTKVVMEHSTAIGVMMGAYAGMRVLSALPAILAAVTAGVEGLTLTMRGLTMAMGWIGVAVAAVTLAYTLFVEKTSEVEKADQRRQNSIQVNIEFLDREIERLTQRNALWNPQTLQFDKAPQAKDGSTLDTVNQAFDAKSAALAAVNAQVAKLQPGDANIYALSSQQAALTRQVEDLAKKRWELTAKQETFDVQSSVDATRRGQESTVNAINNFIRQGEAYDKLSANYAGKDNEAFLRKTQQAKAIRDQMVAGTVSNPEAVAQLSILKAEASSLLASRAPKADPKGDNDRLNADLKRLDLGLQLERLQSQANIADAKQQNKRGELGDLQLINVELAEKLSLDQKGVEVARQQYLLTTDVKNKTAKGQEYTNKRDLATQQAVIDTNAAAEARMTVLDRMAQEEQKLDAKTMADKGQFVKAFLSNYEASYGNTIERVTADLIANEGTIYEEGLSRYLSYLAKLKEAGTNDARGKEMKASFDVAFGTLEQRLQALGNNSGAGSGLSAIFDNALRAEQTFADALPGLIKKQAEMQALADAPGGTDAQKKGALDELKRIEAAGARVRGIWVDIGKDIQKSLTDAFGKPGAALGTLIARSLEYATKQKQIDADLAKNSKGTDAIQLAELQKKAALDSASAQISAYGDMAGAAKGFFNEQSGGYQILATAEKAFRIAELAMTFETMAAKLFATTTVTTAKVTASTIEAGAAVATVPIVVGAEATKSSAYGVTALAASLALPFPANLGAFAVVAGMLAAIGVAVASSGGSGGPSLSEERQKQNGTGTVFGDSAAKSDSIAKTLAMVEKNTFQDLAISNSMLTALQNIEAGIGGLGALVTRQVGQGTAFGDMKSSNNPLIGSTATLAAAGATAGAYLGSAFGPIGTAAGALIGAALGALSRVKTEVTDQGLNLKQQSLGDTIRNGASGSSYADVSTKKSFLGITYSNSNDRNSTSLPADTLQQFTLVIASLRGGVLAAADALGVGGDAFIAKLDAINVGITNLSTKGLTGEEIQKQLEAAFSSIGDTLASQALGGMEQFAKVGEGYLETVMRVAAGYQTVDVVFQSFGKVFGQVGLESVAARQHLIDLAGGIDQFTSQGAFFLKNFFSSGEQAAALKTRIDPTLQKYGLSTVGADATEIFKNFVVALDTTTAAGAQTYQELMTIAPAFKSVIDSMRDANAKAKDLQDQIDEMVMTKAQLLAKARALDIVGMEASTVVLYDRLAALKAEQDALQAMRDNATGLLDSVDVAFAALQRGIDREKAAKTAAHDLEMKSLQERIDTETAAIAKHKALSDAIKSTLEQMHVPGTEAASRADAQAQIRAALAIARVGGPLPDAENLRAPLAVLTKDSSSLFSTMQDYLRDFYSTQNDVASLGSLADDSLTVEQKTLDVLTAQKDASQLAFDNEIKRLDGIVDTARTEVEYLKGMDTSLLTIADLLRQLNATMLAARSNPIVGATASINDAYQTALGRAPEAAGLKFWQDQAANGLSTADIVSSISNSPEAKIQAMYKSTLGRSADPAGMQFWMNAVQQGVSLDAIQGAFLQSAEYKHNQGIPGFADGGDHFGGLRLVGEKGPEVEATGASRIHSTSDLMASLRNPSNEALIAELREQRRENLEMKRMLEAHLYTIAKHAQTMADIQEKQEAIGMPPEREEVP